VTATQPGNALYRAASAAAVTFHIAKAAPRISWPKPAEISAGTPLGTGQLDARATFEGKVLKGTFAYMPRAGTMLPAGTDTLSVTFTPSDRADYLTASASTKITVRKTKQ
jgi:hypothetical protein